MQSFGKGTIWSKYHYGSTTETTNVLESIEIYRWTGDSPNNFKKTKYLPNDGTSDIIKLETAINMIS
jgi:hypothetical protein